MTDFIRGFVVFLTVAVVGVTVVGSTVVSTANTEARLRVAIEAKQKDNQNEYDNMWKTIKQTAQVADKQQQTLKDIIVGNAQARTGQDSQTAVMKWTQEACPNVNQQTLENLQNIISTSRDRFTFRQKELLDLSREYNTMYQVFPTNIILKVIGRKAIKVQIVTSSRTSSAFVTGKDDEVNVFN